MAAKKKKKTPAKKTNTKSKSSKKRTKKPSLFLRLSKWVLVLGLWGMLFLGGAILWFAKDLPDITKGATFEKRTLFVIQDRNGETLARYGESKGENLSVSNLPDHLVQAVIATEDRRFYDHHGVDPFGIARAMATNVIKGRYVQGGSTITQQLAKNLFLTHDRKITRKIREALLAIWLERELTKDEILSAYMNRVYLGSGTYGFDAAARLYFDKSARDVNLLESAVLAGLLKAPSKYSPHNNPERAKKRADIVLNAMIDAGYITKADMTPENMSLSLPNRKDTNEQNIRYFTDWVLEGVDDLVGSPDMDLIVETSLDAKMQTRAQNALKNAIDKNGYDSFLTQGGILSMRPDGAILVMVGGYDYGESQFNRTTLAVRPPGSSFKPFVYLTALRNGWDSDDKIMDAPIKTGEYKPKNFADKYYGEVTLTDALTHSMNTAAVRLAEQLGMGAILKTARDAGILADLNRDLSTALGSSGVPMLQLTTAYATIANGGYRVYPYAITRIRDASNGRVLYDRKAPSSYVRIFDRNDISDLTGMMQSVVENGTGRAARLNVPVAGKTGTSQDSRDAWFAGFTSSVVSVVWLGNDDNSPMRGITGGGLPARIWREVMSGSASSYEPISEFPSQNQGSFTNMLEGLFSSSGSSEFKPNNDRKPYSGLNE